MKEVKDGILILNKDDGFGLKVVEEEESIGVDELVHVVAVEVIILEVLRHMECLKVLLIRVSIPCVSVDDGFPCVLVVVYLSVL